MIGTSAPVQNKPQNLLSWVRSYSEPLFEIGRKTAIPSGFQLPLDAIVSLIKETFKCTLENVQLSTPDWKEVSQTDGIEFLKSGSVDGYIAVEIPSNILDILSCSLLGIDTQILALQEDSLIKATRKVTQAHLLGILSEIPELKQLSLAKFEGVPEDSPSRLTYTIQCNLNKSAFTLLLSLSKDFCLSWHRAEKEAAAIQKIETAEIPLILEAGQIETSVEELTAIEIGDFIQIDHSLFSPKSEKLKAVVSLEGKPLFHVRVKEGTVKVVETPLQYQELIAMTDSVQNQSVDDQKVPDESEVDIENNPFEGEEEEEKEEAPQASKGKSTEVQPEELKTVKKLNPKDIPIKMTVELARLKMSASQLLELQPGSVLDMEIHPENGVSLSISGKVVGKGELIQVGNALGVRILQLNA